ncbi:hypothetical protein ACSNOI_45515 [Actinomadura kijaniata]|uniref:hypothetical protein n=1 Tax=Actinomadura kijaniata TaxID=46161 RepID=UPI003F1AED14
MADAVGLVLADNPADEEVLQLVAEADGDVLPDEFTDGLLEKGEGTVWISVRSEYQVHREEEELISYQKKLGAPVMRQLLLNISRGRGSEELAFDFILRAASRWRLLVDNGWGDVYTPDELVGQARRSRREGISIFFPT